MSQKREKKQKPILPPIELTDDERYGNYPSCSLRPKNYTDFNSSPALMGTMLRSEQQMRKAEQVLGPGSLDILNQIEKM